MPGVVQDYDRLKDREVFQQIVEAANEKQQTLTITLKAPAETEKTRTADLSHSKPS